MAKFRSNLWNSSPIPSSESVILQSSLGASVYHKVNLFTLDIPVRALLEFHVYTGIHGNLEMIATACTPKFVRAQFLNLRERRAPAEQR